MSAPIYSKVKDIPLGSKIIFGKNKFSGNYMNGEEDISWIVLSNDHYKKDSGYPKNAVTMITEKVIRYMAFDAKETSNAVPDRQSSGNNRWRTSNIRQWLNSDGFAGQWYVPQNIGESGTDNRDTPPTAEYMLNTPRNYPYYNNDGFLRFLSSPEKNAVKPANIRTMIPTVSEDRDLGETTKDYIYLPSLTEISGLDNGDIASDDSYFEGEHILTGKLNRYRNARATTLGLINGANFELNPETDKVYFYRSPSKEGNDIRRYADIGSTASSSNIKPFNSEGIRPMTNIDSESVVIQEGNGLYRFVDNAKPYAILNSLIGFKLNLSLYEYDDYLESVTVSLNGEQIESISIDAKKEHDIIVTLPYSRMVTGNNAIEIIVKDTEGLEGVKKLNARMNRRDVPVSGDKVATKNGESTVEDTEIDSDGFLTITLDKNIVKTVKKDELVEKVKGNSIPEVAINDDYVSVPKYQEMRLKSIDFDKKNKEATEEWEFLGIGRYSHMKLGMSKEGSSKDISASKIAQIFTYREDIKKGDE